MPPWCGVVGKSGAGAGEVHGALRLAAVPAWAGCGTAWELAGWSAGRDTERVCTVCDTSTCTIPCAGAPHLKLCVWGAPDYKVPLKDVLLQPETRRWVSSIAGQPPHAGRGKLLLGQLLLCAQAASLQGHLLDLPLTSRASAIKSGQLSVCSSRISCGQQRAQGKTESAPCCCAVPDSGRPGLLPQASLTCIIRLTAGFRTLNLPLAFAIVRSGRETLMAPRRSKGATPRRFLGV